MAGVVFEVAVVVAEYFHGLKDFRRGTIRSPERPAIRMFVFELFAASLVAIGVAGELGIDFLSRDVETGLRSKNRELVGLFQGASSAAIERASNADERSKQLAGENFRLQAEVLKLQIAASWRVFSKQQHDKLVFLLKVSFPTIPTFRVSFDSAVGNPEALAYGKQLSAAFTDALGPKAEVVSPSGLSTCLECTGVWVCVNATSLAGVATAARTIRQQLELSEVKAAKFCEDPRNNQGPANTVNIIVGPKE